MPRVLGIDIPANKPIEYSLRSIYGIGPATSVVVLENAGIDRTRRTHTLSEEELAQMTMAQISRELEAGAKVQVAGDELVIGPVSSQFAARAVLGLIQTRVERTDYIQKRFNRDPGPGTSSSN